MRSAVQKQKETEYPYIEQSFSYRLQIS